MSPPEEPSRHPFLRRFFEPTDIASLVFFRVGFGLLMLYEVARYADQERVASYWADPTFNFSYFLADWVKPLPGDGLHHLWALFGLCALLIALGAFYRVATAVFCLIFSYFVLLEESKYMNHFYFICLVSFLMIFIPAHRSFSVDALLRPRIRSRTAPAWGRWSLCAMMGIVYFYGGLAKLTPDWLQCEPMRFWLANRIDYPILGKYVQEEWYVHLFSYGGLIFDLSVVPLLIWKRTRMLAFLWAVSFHLLNKWMFGVGIFPWLSIAATTLFFRPDWPRRIGRAVLVSAGITPKPAGDPVAAESPGPLGPRQHAILAVLGVFFAIQLLVPFRAHLYPGAVNWTEQGHTFSWRMMLRDKSSDATFTITETATGKSWEVDLDDYLTPRQIGKMSTRPHMIHKFAHHLAEVMEAEGRGPVEVRAEVWCSLNGRKPQLLIDPNVDLAAEPRSLKPKSWILPLKEPLPTPEMVRSDSATNARGEGE
ncbi:MAG: HTTM domain-containing protein [Akkermansiaceae bacterium]|nr:HTTM domain-containing protein [Akkermansiaceae bacterium]